MMTFVCAHRYIILPASFHAVKKRLHFRSGGQIVLDLVVQLDPDRPDFRFPVDISRFKGKTLALDCEPEAVFTPEFSDTYPFAYDGKYRPAVHFTAPRGWMNDPNGLVYHQGRYLMYYQHNPAATTWENMHWGMAESTDLIHWRDRGDVLFPDETGTMFSGSGYVDVNNVSGLGKNSQPPLLCFYTAAGGTSAASKDRPTGQCLAVSTDGGYTLIKHDANPLISEIAPLNRDPKVIPFPADHSFILAMFLQEHDFALFKSPDLLHWHEIQRLSLPDDAECPDFYPLTDPLGQTKWIFTAASDRYVIGTFDGERFTPETEQLRLNWGDTSYAAQSWSELPGKRRVRTAFAHAVIPGMPFGNCMILPQEMTLKNVNGALRLCAWPVDEIRTLVTEKTEFADTSVTAAQPFRVQVPSAACDVTLTLPAARSFEVSLFGVSLRYDAPAAQLRCGTSCAPVRGVDGMLTLRVIYDTVLTEVFADAGSVFMGIRSIQDRSLSLLTVTADNTTLCRLSLSLLKAFYEK